MIVFDAGASSSIKCLTVAVLVAFVSTLVIPPHVLGQTASGSGRDEIIYNKFQEIIKLRANGEYDSAIERLRTIVKEYSNSDPVVWRAYNHLVTTFNEKGDVEGALQVARQALEQFPDIAADEIAFPPRVNEYYDQLREEMFGLLDIKSEPNDCQVFLDGKHVGVTPLQLDLVKAGEHELTVRKSRYHDYTGLIRIQPGVELAKEVRLERECGWICQALRIGKYVAGVGAVVLVVIGLSGGDETPPPPPLDPPPPPPTN